VSRRQRWKPYVPVASRREQAARRIAKLKKSGREIRPVEIEGRKIAKTFWGESWCENLEAYSDYENRLPRGRTYARNGSVIDLQIEAGQVRALVSGSSFYNVDIKIKPLAKKRWSGIKKQCAGRIDSIVELLQGSISKGVMEIVTRHGEGLFPSPKEIELSCSCPDWATMCKHVAAVLYGVGARLDHEPRMLFVLRGTDPAELIAAAVTDVTATRKSGRRRTLKTDDVSSVFGIDLEPGHDSGDGDARQPTRRKPKKAAKKKATAKTRAAATRKKKSASRTKATKASATAKSASKKKPAAKKKKTVKKSAVGKRKKKVAGSAASTRSKKTP